jgi:O-antigen ligase
MAAFAISSAVLVIADRSMRRRTKFLLACAASVAVLSLWGLFEAYYDLYTATGNQAETLTGRTAIWAYVADAIPERLLFGHGFDSMWKVVPAFGIFQARHAENEVLQQLYAFGLIGLALAIAIYASLFRETRRIAASRVRLPVTCLLAYVLVRGLAEAEPFDLLIPLWAVVLLSYLVEVNLREASPAAPAVLAS